MIETSGMGGSFPGAERGDEVETGSVGGVLGVGNLYAVSVLID